MIVIADDYKPLFAREQSVADFLAIDGEEYRNVAGVRRTLRFVRDGQAMFIKAHWGVGWREILKNLLYLRMPVLGARNEWQAIQTLEGLGVATMKLVAYGEQGIHPAHRKSFVITEELGQTQQLDHWLAANLHKYEPHQRVRIKWAIIDRLADIARRLHDHGLNHRDFYICHFLVDLKQADKQHSPENPRMYLIDLHRVQQRRQIPMRWRVKDLAGLLYSAWYDTQGWQITRTDVLRFIKTYCRCSPRRAINEHAVLWHKSITRVSDTYYKDNGRKPRLDSFYTR